jgi:hypothetical protein
MSWHPLAYFRLIRGKHSSLFWCSFDDEEKSFLTPASEMERRYLQRQIELGEEQLAIVHKLQPGVNLANDAAAKIS